MQANGSVLWYATLTAFAFIQCLTEFNWKYKGFKCGNSSFFVPYNLYLRPLQWVNLSFEISISFTFALPCIAVYYAGHFPFHQNIRGAFHSIKISEIFGQKSNRTGKVPGKISKYLEIRFESTLGAQKIRFAILEIEQHFLVDCTSSRWQASRDKLRTR